MSRLLLSVLLLLAILGTSGDVVSAAKFGPASFAFNLTITQRDTAVQQETPCYWTTCHDDPSQWVINNTNCVWDVDETTLLQGSRGDLDPYTTAVGSVCAIADGLYNSFGDDPHVLGVLLWATSSDLVVSLTASAGNPDNQASLAPVWDPSVRMYRYHWCAPNGVDPPGPYPSVPDSNGGWGYRDDLSLSVTNPTKNKVRNISGWLGVGAGTYTTIDCPRTWLP